MSQLVAIISAVFAALAVFGALYWTLVWLRGFLTVDAGVVLPEQTEGQSFLRRAWLIASERIAPKLPENLAVDLERKIVQAGGLAGMTPARIITGGAFAGAAGLAMGLLFVVATGASATWVLLLTTLGALLPFLWLRDQVKERHLRILTDLPFHLDLLTLCVEAGLDFSAGVMKMVEKGRPGPLRDEFNNFLGEIRLGKTRAEALESMSERVALQELSGFLSALIQAERLGSGLSKTLRAQSDQLRIARFQRAETKAGEAPVKMLLPLVLFVFPTIWIILAAPLVFEWVYK